VFNSWIDNWGIYPPSMLKTGRHTYMFDKLNAHFVGLIRKSLDRKENTIEKPITKHIKVIA
jgi:hypothetical protein